MLLSLGVGPASANEYGNPDYLGIVKASPPQGFPVSPAFLDLSTGPASVNFSVPATNLTTSDQATPIELSLHRILTFRGQDVSDGQPGQPGISFPPGMSMSSPRSCTALVRLPPSTSRQAAGDCVPHGGHLRLRLLRDRLQHATHPVHLPGSWLHREPLAAARSRTTTLPGMTTTTLSGTTSTTGGSQVLATVVSTTPSGQLPVTGTDSSVLVGVAALLLLVGGGFIVAGRRPKRA